MTKFETALIRFAFVHLLIVTSLAFVFRIYLVVQHPIEVQSILTSICLGVLFDVVVAIYTLLPFVFIFSFFPNRWIERLNAKSLLRICLIVDMFISIFVLVGEYLFYDEFKDRFNFIAVDYLVYTNEVLQNIWQSYPLLPILSGIFVLAGVGAFLIGKFCFQNLSLQKDKWWHGARVALVYSILMTICLVLVNEVKTLSHSNAYEELVGKNGLHALFAAYRNNEIKFDRFYTTMDSAAASGIVHNILEANHILAETDRPEDEQSIVRNIHESQPFHKLNVVLILMESMSARFMGLYGNPEGLTPNLDRLARQGLFFDRIYATGTRTVRGIEAVVLSIPPTPGQSIVRRPAGVGIFNIGTPFRHHGYETNFIYGGRAIFDNMGTFFAGNGFTVFDQSTFAKDENQFTNAWGVSDEDLFNNVIRLSDLSAKNKTPFFHLVLTTSNHRPYTYPSGRVATASGTGRSGAVQYSDYAIGKLIHDASSKSWFENTVFIFVADHNASVSGQSVMDPNDYLVPMIMYSPKWIKPEVIHHMGSQIDLAPTLFEFLSASYQSRFFGMELQDDNPARAFIGTYQNVGYLTESSLTVLAPNHKVQDQSWNGKTVASIKTSKIITVDKSSPETLLTAVAFYKTASDWFSNHLLEEKKRISEKINTRN